MNLSNDNLSANNLHGSTATCRNQYLCSVAIIALALCVAPFLGCEKSGSQTTPPTQQSQPKSAGSDQPPPVKIAPQEPKIRWQFKAEKSAFEAAPLLANGRIYIGDVDANVYALDLATGKILWQFTKGAGFTAQAAIKANRIYIGDIDGLVYCLDADTGKPVWTFNTDGPISATVTFHQERVLVASQDSHLYCLDSKTGKLIWKFAASHEIHAGAMVQGDRAIVIGACSSILHVVDLKTGKGVKEFELPGETTAQLATQGKLAFAATMHGDAFCIDWENDGQKWMVPLDPHGSSQVKGGATVTNGMLIIGSDDQHVRALDASSGKILWEFRAKGSVDAPVTVHGKNVFFATSRGHLYALDERTGTELWKFELGGDIRGALALHNDVLVAANGNGTIFCIGPINALGER